MPILFVVSILVLIYTYVLYPYLVILLGKLINKPIKKDFIQPYVTLIITAHNEEKCIRAKIQNSLELDYPKDKLEIIVASDCSSDYTNDIVREFSGKGIVLCEQKERLGKTAAQSSAVEISKGDVLVFSDASTIYHKEAILHLVGNFQDQSIGCVGGNTIFISETEGKKDNKNEIADIEHKIREYETKIYSTVAVSGCIYAVRRKAYREIDHRIADDFGIPLDILMRGYRVVFEPEAIAYEEIEKHTINARRNIRTVNQGWVALQLLGFIHLAFKKPLRFFYISFILLGHKVLRWLTFLFLLAIFFSSIFLAVQRKSKLFSLLLTLQLLFYLVSCIGGSEKLNNKIFSIPYRFCLYHLSSLAAFYKFCKGEKIVIWNTQK